jgi:hypothetical protein
LPLFASWFLWGEQFCSAMPFQHVSGLAQVHNIGANQWEGEASENIIQNKSVFF